MVKFFRMSDRGTVRRPTLPAVIAFAMAAVATLFFLREHPLIGLIAWVIEYLFFSVVLSAPFRIPLGAIMHATRWGVITSIPTTSDKLWLAANIPLFEKTGLRLYHGENLSPAGKGESSNIEDQDIERGLAAEIRLVYERSE